MTTQTKPPAQDQAPILSAELAELRKLAEAATPGPWRYTKYGSVMNDAMSEVIMPADSINANKRFAVAANPAVILRLLDALAAAPAVPAQEQSEFSRIAVGEAYALMSMMREDVKVADFRNALVAYGQACRAAQKQAVSCPDGWKLVPIEPTVEMLTTEAIDTGERTSRTTWAGMLAAAPTPPAAPQPRELTGALEQIAESWDGCMYDAPGETVDIGADLRRAFAKVTAPAQNSGAAHQEGAV